MVFLELPWKPGVYSRVTDGWPFKIRVCSVTTGLLSTYEGYVRNLQEAWHSNMDASRGEAGDKGTFLVATVILGFLSIFKNSQALSPFEALNSVCLLSFQIDVRPPIQTIR